MVGKRWHIVVLAALLLALGACAPKATPTPAPIPIAPAIAPTAPAPAARTVTPEEATWAKVIEAAKKEGKVTVYAWAYTGETSIEIANTFKSRYNIQVDLITGRGAEFTERLKTERRTGQMTADVVESAALHLSNMKREGLLEVAQGLPSLRNKDDFRLAPLMDKEGYILNYNVNIKGPTVNTKLIRPGEEPKSLQELLDPKWKGKLLAGSPLLSGGLYLAYLPLVNAKAISLDWLRAIGKQDLILTRGDQDTADRLSRGEAPISLDAGVSMLGSYVKEGAPIKAIPMAEGYTANTLGIVQTKGSPHPNAARLFIDWILSPEGQTASNKYKGNTPLRKDVTDFRPEALRLPPTAKLVPETESDMVEEAQKFADKWLIELWKQ